MFFSGAGKERAAGGCRSPGPQERAAAFHPRREDLVLQIAVRDADAFDQLSDALRFGDGTRQRLFAGDAAQRPLATFERVDDLLDVLDARVIGTGEPERIDRRIRDQFADRRVWLRGSDVETPRKRGGGGRVL